MAPGDGGEGTPAVAAGSHGTLRGPYRRRVEAPATADRKRTERRSGVRGQAGDADARAAAVMPDSGEPAFTPSEEASRLLGL
ncbi:hypothetical protein GCM10025331_58900 [Actinoplanes utahensis]|nr:hypothetical protein Aut01nite_70390 [Actinoplanes utahensis]